MLKALTLQKKRTALNTKLKQLRAKQKKLRDQETDLEKEIEALEEIPAEIEAQVDELSQQQTQVSDDIAQVLDELETIDRYKADFQDAVAEQEGLWIKNGGPTDDEWEAYKNMLSKNCGMDKLLEVYQAAYDRYAAAE